MNRRFATPDDPRSTEELLRLAVRARTWGASRRCIDALGFRSPRDVLPAAERFCSSKDRKRRAVGASIVARICDKQGARTRASKTLAGVLDRAADAREAAFILERIARWKPPRILPVLRATIQRLAKHPSARVRLAVAQALGGEEDKKSIDVLLHLMDDRSPRVRDWATFAMGELSQQDSNRIRNALAKRLNDTDPDTYAEAVYGLAKRRDERAYAILLAEFEKGECGSLLFRAASEMRDTRLYPPLRDLLRKSKKDPAINPGWLAELESAVRDLKPRKRRHK